MKLIKHQRPDIDKFCSYIKDPFASKYQLLIYGKEKVRIKHKKNSKAFTDWVTHFLTRRLLSKKETKIVNIVWWNDSRYGIEQKVKTKSCWIFHERKKCNISGAFISLSYFLVPKNIRLSATDFLSWRYFTKENFNKKTLSHSSDIDLKYFMKL